MGGKHRHIPEILQNFAHAAGKSAAEASEFTLGFTPILAPMSRGILATVSARMTDKAKTLSDEEIRAVWSKAYEGQDFMVLLPEGTLPATGNIIGSNAAHLQVVTDRKGRPHLRFCRHRQPQPWYRRTSGPITEHRTRPAGRRGPDQDRSSTVSVTFAQGFSAAGVAAGISSVEGKKDLALVVNNGPLDAAAGVFTSNRFCAAPGAVEP